MRAERKRSKIVINITSLIDVIFLLLIFFLVTSTFSEQPGLKIDLPRAASSESREMEDVILSVTRKGNIFLNRQPVERNELPLQLRKAAEATNDPALILRADRQVSYGLIVELMDTCRQSGLNKIVALTTSETQ